MLIHSINCDTTEVNILHQLLQNTTSFKAAGSIVKLGFYGVYVVYLFIVLLPNQGYLIERCREGRKDPLWSFDAGCQGLKLLQVATRQIGSHESVGLVIRNPEVPALAAKNDFTELNSTGAQLLVEVIDCYSVRVAQAVQQHHLVKQGGESRRWNQCFLSKVITHFYPSCKGLHCPIPSCTNLYMIYVSNS